MYKVVIPFIRRDALNTYLTALVEVTCSKKLTPESIMKQIKRIVTDWTASTKEGKRCLDYAGGDINIGDIASYDESLHDWIVQNHTKYQVKDLILLPFIGIQNHDTVLVNQEE